MKPEPWPRQYAADIAALPTREERREALARVPAKFRPMVRLYVEMAFRAKARQGTLL